MAKHLTAHRLNGIGEYYFSQKLREIAEMNTRGENVLNLGIGSPDLKPPKKVEKALIEALTESNSHQYQPYKGLEELRFAFSSWYRIHFQTDLSPDNEILPLIGSKEGIMHTSMALLDPEDGVLVPNPGYPSYAAAARLAGGKCIPYALTEDNGYYPDFEELEKIDLKRVKLMWVNYPHMPTGTDSSADLFESLLKFSRKHQIIIVNDNPYGFILTSEQKSLLKDRMEDDLVLELNSLSKSHNMAGWRIGMIGGQKDLIQSILTFKSNMDSGQFKPVMRAAIEALNVPNDWYKDQNTIYEKRRALVREIANQLTCQYNTSQVGMFLWCRIPDSEANGKAFADDLLHKYRIFIPPGSVFGSEGEKYIRFSLCSDIPVWEEVIDRIQN